MFIVVNDKNDKTYSIYKFLREEAPDANIDTLKQISVYIAVTTNDSFDIDRSCDLKLFDNSKEDECFLLSVLDGRKIIFSNNSKVFGFSILNYNIKNHIFMMSEVYEKIVGDLSTLTVYSQIDTRDFGKYVVTFRPNNMCDETVKFGTINYYTTEEVNWVYEISDMDNIKRDFDIVAKNNGIYPFTDKMFFDISLEYFDTELDCYDGCLRNYLSRVDLLYNNLLVYMNTDEKKKIRKM